MRRPRWFFKLWASWWDYFWLPCPLCGTYWSGFEWSLDGFPTIRYDTDPPGLNHGICTSCLKTGRATSRW